MISSHFPVWIFRYSESCIATAAKPSGWPDAFNPKMSASASCVLMSELLTGVSTNIQTDTIAASSGSPPISAIPEIESRALDNREPPVVDRLMVTPGYFHLLGLPLLRGRWISEADDDKSPQVAVVNEAFARRYWPGEDAISKRFRRDRADAPWITIVFSGSSRAVKAPLLKSDNTRSG